VPKISNDTLTNLLPEQAVRPFVRKLKRFIEFSARTVHERFGGPKPEVSRDTTERNKIIPLLNILLALIVVGFLLWLVNRFIPMAGGIKSILNGVVVIGVVLWLLNVFGIFYSLSRIRVG